MNVASFWIYWRYTFDYVNDAHVGLKDSAVYGFHSGLPDCDVCNIPISNEPFCEEKGPENAEFDCKGDGVSQN